MSIIESIKAVASDEKVQMFVLGAAAGALVTGSIAYLCSGNKTSVIAEAVDAVVEPVVEKDEQPTPKPETKTDDNPTGESVE